MKKKRRKIKSWSSKLSLNVLALLVLPLLRRTSVSLKLFLMMLKLTKIRKLSTNTSTTSSSRRTLPGANSSRMLSASDPLLTLRVMTWMKLLEVSAFSTSCLWVGNSSSLWYPQELTVTDGLLSLCPSL